MKSLVQKLLSSKFSRDTLWLITAQFLVLLVGFLLNFGVEANYGLEDLGYFTQTTSFYMIFSNLFALGLNNTTIKKVSENTGEAEIQKNIFSQNLLVSIIISTILSLFVYLFLNFFPQVFSSEILVELLSVQMIGVPFFSANKQFAAFYSGQRMQKAFAVQRIIRWGGIGTLLFIFVALNYPLLYVVLTFVYVEVTLFLYNVIRNYTSINLYLNLTDIKSNLSFGLKSYIAEILAAFNSNMDVILLGYLLSASDLGIYSFMIFFVKALYIFPGIIMQNISPLISTLWQNQQIEDLQRKIKSLVKVNLIIALIQFIGMIVFYYFIVRLFKPSMDGSAFYFIIAGFGTFIFSLVSWSGSMLVMAGKLRANFYRTLMILIVSTVNILVFGYYFELLGASMALFINGILNFLIMRVLIKKEMGINIFI